MGESAAAKRAGGHGLPPARKLWALWSCDLLRAAKPDAVSHQGGRCRFEKTAQAGPAQGSAIVAAHFDDFVGSIVHIHGPTIAVSGIKIDGPLACLRIIKGFRQILSDELLL